MPKHDKPPALIDESLLKELSALIEKSKQRAVSQANSVVTMLFWQIGKRINEEILHNKRAEYGKQIVAILARGLSEKYGRNFEEKNLRRMLQFAEQFPDKEIVVTLSRQLTWSHFLLLIPLDTSGAKLFYAEQAVNDKLGVRDLRRQISTKAYERAQIANAQIGPESKIPENTFKDPYIFDFFELKDTYLEKDVEAAILRGLESFILELGKGFAFVERQKRMIIDGEDFYLDLLFYHRRLKRLVAIELKLDKFQAKYKGQMELYLKWLDRYERQSDENAPIGLILCTGGGREQIELLETRKDGIMVAEYWTDLPPKKELEEKLHRLLIEARERIEARKLFDGRLPRGKE
jgi:predicted nuclease of restriction endonuclease-like (RecB) superfamily